MAELEKVQHDLETVMKLPEPDWEDDDALQEFLARRMGWWDLEHTKAWFLARGYTLYHWHHIYSSPTPSQMYPPNAKRTETSFPYALQGDTTEVDAPGRPLFLGATGGRGTVVFATDPQGQHVVLKVMKDGSDEYRINRLLWEQGVPTSIDEFQNVIPVLELLQCGNYWFSVMPRWGTAPDRPVPRTMREVFKFIHCLLKGLNFLHQHKIVHADIATGNILVNHFDRCNNDFFSYRRESLRSEGQLTYALFDFDQSTIFPDSFTLEQCRLPFQKSFNTFRWQIPSDTSHGEPDYDPFAFDVGMLGVTFCDSFQSFTSFAPMLAPLFDKMTTRDIPQRFTALSALRFFEEQVSPLTTELELEALTFSLNGQDTYYDEYDRWKHLDPSFIKTWVAFREPPIPLRLRILRLACRRLWVYRTIAFFRRFFRSLSKWI